MSSLPHSIESNESDSENSECSISKKPESQKIKEIKFPPSGNTSKNPVTNSLPNV